VLEGTLSHRPLLNNSNPPSSRGYLFEFNCAKVQYLTQTDQFALSSLRKQVRPMTNSLMLLSLKHLWHCATAKRSV